MPPKARPAEDVEKPADSTGAPPTAASGAGDDKPGGDGQKSKTNAEEPPATDAEQRPVEDTDEADAPRPGVYRFTWPYACNYLLPDRTSKPVEPGEEVFWPTGAPDVLWEFVSDEPAPAPSDNTPRE